MKAKPKAAPAEILKAARRIEYVALQSVQAAARNPKLHADESINRSVERFGYTEPLLMDERTGRLVAGHGRLAALERRQAKGEEPPEGVQVLKGGEWAVPVVRGWASKNDIEAEAYLLASNQLTIAGGWNEESLVQMLKELDAAQALDGVGFSEDDLNELLKRAAPGSEGEDGAGSLAEKFLVPPFSVLDARQGYWQERKRAWLSIGLKSEVGRGGNLLKFSGFINDAQAGKGVRPQEANAHLDEKTRKSLGAYEAYGEAGAIERAGGGVAGTSIFDPVLCELAYHWFAPVGGLVLDPFAGGSVRGVVAARMGRRYQGVDLRGEQVLANREQAAALARPGDPMPVWYEGDSREVLVGSEIPEQVDFVFSCPPYADLEKYSDDPKDLSTMGYEEFVTAYREIIAKAVARLRPNRFACFVVGEIRDKKGLYRGFVPDTILAFEDAGAAFYNEAILVSSVGSLRLRAGKIFSASRKLGKTHQNVLVFFKGDPARIKEEIGEFEVPAEAFERAEKAEAAASEFGEELP